MTYEVRDKADVERLLVTRRKPQKIIIRSWDGFVPSAEEAKSVFSVSATKIKLLLDDSPLGSAEKANECWTAALQTALKVSNLKIRAPAKHTVVPSGISRLPFSFGLANSLVKLEFSRIVFQVQTCREFSKCLFYFHAMRDLSYLGCDFGGEIGGIILASCRISKVFFGALGSDSHESLLRLSTLADEEEVDPGEKYIFIGNLRFDREQNLRIRRWVLSMVELLDGMETYASEADFCFGNAQGMKQVISYCLTTF